MQVQFTKAADASNRAVMADTDEASTAFAREAEQANTVVQADAEALAPLLRNLAYTDESRLLEEFGKRFAEYRALDKSVLDLAVENTNLKAQRLSFGPAREAADAARDALDAVVHATPAKTACRVQPLVADTVIALREIQILHARHIAESDDAVMTKLEGQMDGLERTARAALKALSTVAEPASAAQLAAATAAVDLFKGVHSQIVTLSRRNSNVRSLALSLGQKRTLTAACDGSLRALQDALAKEGFKATR